MFFVCRSGRSEVPLSIIAIYKFRGDLICRLEIIANLVQISLTVHKIMGCLDSGTSDLPERHTKILEQPRRLFGDLQISWRSYLPFRNYSDFKFTQVWLENMYSRSQSGVLGDLTP